MLSPADPTRLLQIWSSPAFPIGAFAYSHGLEAAVTQGLVTGRASLEAWLRDLMRGGSVRTDAVLLAAAWRAAGVHDVAALSAINDLALALQPSAERHLETAQQGTSFVATIVAAWPCAVVGSIVAADWPAVALPVAFGAAAAGHALPLADTADVAALGTVQNLVSAAIRLSVIGQTDGQRVVAALLGDLEALRIAARRLTLDYLGSGAFSSDLASLEHETLYSRLFRS